LTETWKKFLESVKEFPFFIKEIVIPKIPHSLEKMGITKIHSFAIDKKEVSLNLEILTWRTHQIRYHLSSKWLPIIGDYLYGTDEWIPMQLTAYKLIFPDLQGNLQTIELK
jgi:23S rRNA-/tRNA-specific pseudouridylate synthase